MVAVLLVLMALFVLCAPFLVTVRNADQASAESADRSVLRVTLDSAARHAAAGLAASHPALDTTPYFDDESELAVATEFPPGFLPTNDPTQPMWDLDAADVAARVDLASASPHVLANLLGCAARLTEVCKADDATLALSDADGFLDEGVVLVDDEVIGYGERTAGKLGRLQRGLLAGAYEKAADAAEPAKKTSGTQTSGSTKSSGEPAAEEAPAFECGPQLPSAHDIGAFVIDQRAFALCEWRIAGGELRAYDGIEQVREA